MVVLKAEYGRKAEAGVSNVEPWKASLEIVSTKAYDQGHSTERRYAKKAETGMALRKLEDALTS